MVASTWKDNDSIYECSKGRSDYFRLNTFSPRFRLDEITRLPCTFFILFFLPQGRNANILSTFIFIKCISTFESPPRIARSPIGHAVNMENLRLDVHYATEQATHGTDARGSRKNPGSCATPRTADFWCSNRETDGEIVISASRNVRKVCS